MSFWDTEAMSKSYGEDGDDCSRNCNCYRLQVQNRNLVAQVRNTPTSESQPRKGNIFHPSDDVGAATPEEPIASVALRNCPASRRRVCSLELALLQYWQRNATHTKTKSKSKSKTKTKTQARDTITTSH